MKKNIYVLSAVLLCFVLILSSCVTSGRINRLKPENTWVVLAEKNNYSSKYSNLNINFRNTTELRKLFLAIGVPEENILWIKDDLGEQQVKESIQWLADKAEADGAVFYYIGAHGRYIRNSLRWNFLTPPLWNELPQQNKILIVDSCNAGRYITPFENKPESGITYGVVAADELNWWGEESEGLPIIGSIWVNYFIEAFKNKEADIDGDNLLSFTEAHEFVNSKVQEYARDFIFSNEYFYKSYLDYGYDPAQKEAYPNAVIYNHIDGGLILYEFN